MFSLQCRKLLFCALLCVALSGPRRAYGQQSAAAVPAAGAPDSTAVLKLVADLGADSFVVRQKATAALLRLDESALTTLNQARGAATGETQERLQQVLQRLTQRWFQVRLQRLKSDEQVSVTDWPDWSRFVQLAGGTAVPQQQQLLRGLFLELVEAEPELFTARAFDPTTLSGLLEVRAQLFSESCDGRQDRPFSAGSGLTLMLLGSDSSVRLLRATSACISRAFEDPRFSELVTDGVHAASVRGVASGWLLRSGISADRPLLFAIQHRLPAGRELSVRVLQSNSRGPQLYYACMCLAVLDSRQDVSLLESKFSSTTLIWPIRGIAAGAAGERPSGFQVQLQDAALAAAVVLRGGRPMDVGIPAEESAVMLFRMDSLGSTSAEDRAQRLQRYRVAYPEQP